MPSTSNRPAQDSPPENHVVVIGAGPAGCLLALLLAEQGARVSIYDSRKDTRVHAGSPNPDATSDQRSINLALSTRGLTALRQVGLSEKVMKCAIPMHSRCVHSATSHVELQPYGQANQFLLSVSRTHLTHVLQNAADCHPSITLAFRHKCIDVNLETPSVTVQNQNSASENEKTTLHPRLIVGADGTFSKIRAAMTRLPMFNFSQEFIPCSYKELSFVPPTEPSSSSSAHPLAYYPNALHIWPRHEFMLIALPNYCREDIADEANDDVSDDAKKEPAAQEDVVKSFTATLFMKPEEFELLDSDEKIKTFFQTNFPDALPALPSLSHDFKQNPTAPLVTMRCSPFSHAGRVVLIGDAAHAIVPFYGQGCNAAMEDTVVLSDLVASAGWDNLSLALQEYSTRRKPDVDAIADLAIEHFHDMSSKSASTFHVLKRRLEITLNRFMPKSFLPLYTLVSFSNVPYASAVERAAAQDRLLTNVIVAASATSIVASVSLAAVYLFKFKKSNSS